MSFTKRRETPPRQSTLSLWVMALLAAGMGLGAVMLTWGTLALRPVSLPSSTDMIMSPQAAIVVYAVAYAILILLSYRIRNGLYAGFHHVAIIGAYLSVGPLAALITAFAGRALFEVIAYVSFKRLKLPLPPLREAISTSLYLAGANLISIIVAGWFYQASGGPLPLNSLAPSPWLPLLLLLLVNLTIFYVLTVILAFNTPGERWSVTVIPVLVFAEIFSGLLSLLVAIAFYQLPPVGFLIVMGGVLMAASLFRIAEHSRGNLQRRAVELATLNQIGNSLTSSLDMTNLLYSIYDQVSRLVDAQVFYIALYTPDTEMLTFPLVMEGGKAVTWPPRQGNNGLSEYVISTRQTLMLSGNVREEASRLKLQPVAPTMRTYVGIPLKAAEDVIGVLSLENHAQENAYDRAAISLLTTIAAQAAVALRNASLYNRVWEMADELALLNNLSSVVTATLDIDIVLDTTCRVVTRVGRADKTAIFLLSEDGTRLRLAYSVGLSDDFVAQFTNFQRDKNSGPTEVLSHTSAMAISDVMTDPRALGWRTLAELEGYTSLLTVPLVIANDQVIGFLAAFYAQQHIFGKSELELMTTLANQVAVTVSNARLFHDTQARAQAMSRLVDASRTFTATLDINSVAEKILDELQDILTPDSLALLLVGSAGDLLRPLAQRGIKPSEAMSLTGSVSQALVTSKPRALPTNTEDLVTLERLGLESMYIFPLVGDDKVIGIAVVGYVEARILTDRERQLTEALVNQAATAVRNAQLYSQTDAALSVRITQLTAVEDISRKISGSLDLDTIINAVLDTALNITEADAAASAMVTRSDRLDFVERYPASRGLMPTRELFDRHVGIIGRVLRTGKVVRLADVRSDPDYMPGNVPNALSELCVPIVHQGQIVGVIDLESSRAGAFTADHERFMLNLADHAAIAIGNAKLFEERQAQIESLIQNRKLSIDLLSATSLRQVMDLTVENALLLAHAKDAHLYLYNRETDTLTFGASLWLDGRENVEASTPRHNGRTMTVARSGVPQYIEDSSKMVPSPEFRTGPGFGAIARIPLKRGGLTIGVLNIAFRETHQFGDLETRALELLANQAAIAIENARLFEEVRVSRDRMQVIMASMRDGLVLLGNRGEIVLANPSAEQLAGVPFQKFLGRNILRVFVASWHRENAPANSEALDRELRRTLYMLVHEPGTVTRQTFQLMHSGTPLYVEASMIPVVDDTSRVSGRLIVLKDVSEEESIQRLREELTYMIVHDLRSPLSVMISSLRMLEDMLAVKDFSDFNQVAGIAMASAEQQMDLIESMLEVDKLESGKLPMHLARQEIDPLVRQAIASLEVIANNASIQVLDCLPGNLPPVQIDEDQIRRVLTNLLDNALHHTPANGQVRVEGKMLDGQGFVQIGVLDTGKGVPAELREHIFEKFGQNPKSALRGHKGIGLGLTFCKLAVEAHGGHIWVDTNPDPEGGAAFWFTLPVAKDQEA